jgi:hypothetical protein
VLLSVAAVLALSMGVSVGMVVFGLLALTVVRRRPTAALP